MGIVKGVLGANSGLERFQVGVVEFNHLAAAGADEVVVVFTEMHVLVKRSGLSEIQFFHQLAFPQEFQRAVDRGPGDAGAVFLQPLHDLFRLEVPPAAEDLVGHSVALPGALEFLPLQEAEELAFFRRAGARGLLGGIG